MALRDDTNERTIQPTRQHLTEARQRGIVARSGDLTAAVLTLGGFAALAMLGPSLLDALTKMTAGMLAGGADATADAASTGVLLWRNVGSVLVIVAGLLAVLVVLAVAVNMAQVGMLSSPRRDWFDWKRLSPAGGLGKAFSTRAVVRLAMGLAKLAIAAGVAYAMIRPALKKIISLAGSDAAGIAAGGGQLIVSLMLRIGLAMLALATVDLLYQRWQHLRDLRMTRRELQEELSRSSRRTPARRRRETQLAPLGATNSSSEGQTNG